MKSYRKFATAITTLSALAIAPIILSAQTATAQPRGLQGSYVGVALDGNQSAESLSGFLDAGNPESWIVEEALRLQGIRAGFNAESADNKIGSESAGSQFQGRLDLPNTPISVRGAVFLGDNTNAVLPMLSYDLPVTNNANVYAGAGYALVKTPGEATPLGDRNGVVLTTGAEAAISEGLVIYGDAKLGINTGRDDGNLPVKLQVGAGYRF